MTEHEHAEVSRSLALAIGWKHDDVQAAYDKAGELLRRHEA